MAATECTPFPTSASMSMNSFETALCIIPPAHKCRDIENLRELYDKGYGKWPPHLNLVYPFVAPQNLDRACAKIKSHLNNHHDVKETLLVNLGDAGLFEHHNDSTIFLRDSQNPEHGSLASLRTTILKALGQEPTPCNFHLTIGQSESNSESSKSFLLAKARFLPKLEFQVHNIAILVRERGANQGGATGRMKLWGNIDISDATPRRSATPPEFWISPLELHEDQRQFEGEYEDDEVIQEITKFSGREVQSGETYKFQSSTSKWAVTYGNDQKDLNPTCVAVSSYNVLAESVCPAPRHRDPLLLEILTSKSASADIAVLQEVSDEFLSYLLDNEEVRHKYPFVSHAPPSQSDIGPLPSLRNIVMLSKWYFDWVSVPFHRRHKGAIVATFPNVIKLGTGATLPFVVAGIHLTSGLTDGSVAAKKVQLQCLTNYLSQNHGDKPWIISGDFNLTTSSSTIETAIQNRSISPQSLATLTTIEHSLTEAGLLDAWSVTRVEGTDEMLPWDSDDLFEGEEGATFNPRGNALAATASGTSNNRPQRYDRVLVRPQDVIQIRRFNYFGFPETRDGTEMVASDHVGIRALMQLMPTSSQPPAYDSDILKRNSVQLQGLKGKFSSASELSSTLTSHGMFPTKEEVQHRQEAFEIIKKVLLGLNNNEESTAANIPMIVVPVGSYALGVWTSASDIDCLCIGSISPKTFFSLARQRINKAENHGVRLLRKVEANTGTMFELSVAGVNMDLQYCPAARVVESWPNFHELPSSDPVFNLPILSLRKLKPYRDISYIQRTLPSLPAFRLAYRCIKLWAVQRGLYSSRFGYLGGVHITLLLSWVCKRLAHDGHTINAPDLVASFFHHYAHFDWAGDMVFDVFFHKKKPRYSRTSREPMVVLGFHAPNANIAYTGTVAGLQTLVKEFKAAAARLSDPNMTWNEFFEPNGTLEPLQMNRAAAEFLEVHDSYVKIDIQYWGRTLSMGKSLVGWVESRCLLLVVDLQKSLSNIEVRIWPERFTDTDQYSSESSDYHGCYLIGLSKSSSSEIGANKEDRHLARQTLDKLLDRFLTQLQADEKHHDPTSSWIGISLAKTSDVKNMRLDDREWGDYVADLDPDSDDDEDLFVPDEADDNATERKVPIRTKASSSGPVSTAKLRPASDVLNRLLWDPNLDPSDYVIGYEDRFLGVKETTLERWKTEQTDEEFIPQHRILYFKTKAEGVIVWDRARRIDGIFGSGVGAGDGGGEGRTHVN